MTNVIHLEGNGIQNTEMTIDVLDTSPVTDIQMSIEPSVTPTQMGLYGTMMQFGQMQML